MPTLPRDLPLRVPTAARRPLALLLGLGLAVGASWVIPVDSFWLGFALGAVLTLPALYLGFHWERMGAKSNADPAA